MLRNASFTFSVITRVWWYQKGN